MKPYGLRPKQCSEDLGPPTRWGNLNSKHRREARRLLHKQARNDAKKQLRFAQAN